MLNTMKVPALATKHIQTISSIGRTERQDALAIEEPLEIRLGFELAGHRAAKSISITMRTPGDDFALAAGFLFTEGIIAGAKDIDEIHYCGDPDTGEESPNIVRVELVSTARFDAGKLQRNFYTTSSCGVCGKASLEALRVLGVSELAAGLPRIDEGLVHGLPDRLRSAQVTFEQTGGLHAAGLFDEDGELLALAEDVGRHNALDKLIGARLLAGEHTGTGQILVVSGRTSFEIIQKALVAQIPIVVAVGAPSSLAVDLASEYGMTLIGFARGGRYNVYTGFDRIV